MDCRKAHDIWGKVVNGTDKLTEEEVCGAAKWFDDFSVKLADKKAVSCKSLEEAKLKGNTSDILKKQRANDSDKRQLEDCIKRYNDLIAWKNSHHSD